MYIIKRIISSYKYFVDKFIYQTIISIKLHNVFNSKYNVLDDKIVFTPYFNQPLNKYVELISMFNQLEFGYRFNHPIDNFLLNLNLTHLVFGDCFNQQVSRMLPDSLIYLEFGLDFNQSVNNLPSNLTHLKFSWDFSQQIDNLPNIVYLSVSNNLSLDNLPNSLKELVLGLDFNLELNNLPNQLKKISIRNVNLYDKELNNLPESVELIELPIGYDKKLSKLPKNLKTIRCDRDYKFKNDFVGYNLQTY